MVVERRRRGTPIYVPSAGSLSYIYFVKLLIAARYLTDPMQHTASTHVLHGNYIDDMPGGVIPVYDPAGVLTIVGRILKLCIFRKTGYCNAICDRSHAAYGVYTCMTWK